MISRTVIVAASIPASVLIALLGVGPPTSRGADGRPDLPMLLASDESVEAMERGRDLLLRFRLRESEEVFGRLAMRKDGQAAAYYFLGYSSALKLLVSDEDQYYDEFFRRADSLSRALDSAPESPWRALIRAESALQRALVRAKRGKYWRAAMAGRKAYLRFDRLVDRYPGFSDAYKGLGLLHVAVGSLPGIYRTFFSILGVHGSVDDGLVELRAAADSSLYAREEAGIMLSLFDILVDEDEQAGRRLSEMYGRYPDSPLFGHLYGFYLYSERKADSALVVLQSASDRSAAPEYFELDYVDFYLADTLFRLERYVDAIPVYQRYLDNHPGPALKALASLGMGISLERVGQRHAAESFYHDVKAAREFDSDRAARRLAEKLLKHPMSDTDLRLLSGRNAFDSGRYGDAERVLTGLLANGPLKAEAIAEAHYRLGRCKHVTGSLAEAMEHYRAAVAARAGDKSRWAPWATYYIGRIYESEGQYDAAGASYDNALTFRGDYDYRQALEKNAKVALRRVELLDE